MGKLVINSYADFEQYVGKELGVSDYVCLDQERINLFADATLDHQWIHVDAEKAAVESPFKSTIAHGYLTLLEFFVPVGAGLQIGLYLFGSLDAKRMGRVVEGVGELFRKGDVANVVLECMHGYFAQMDKKCAIIGA
jgi:hypothetical protein